MSNVRFFWIGEPSEIFAAESWEQILADAGESGTGLEKFVDGVPVDDWGDPIDWGEIDGSDRLTVRDCDEDERRLGTLTGSMHDHYAWQGGERYGLPVMMFTQYN